MRAFFPRAYGLGYYLPPLPGLLTRRRTVSTCIANHWDRTLAGETPAPRSLGRPLASADSASFAKKGRVWANAWRMPFAKSFVSIQAVWVLEPTRPCFQRAFCARLFGSCRYASRRSALAAMAGIISLLFDGLKILQCYGAFSEGFVGVQPSPSAIRFGTCCGWAFRVRCWRTVPTSTCRVTSSA